MLDKEYLRILITAVLSVASTLLVTYLSQRHSFRLTELQLKAKENEWQREREAKMKEELQHWFEEFYLIDCIDPLLIEAEALKDLLLKIQMNQKSPKKMDMTIPLAETRAYINLFSLIGSSKLTTLMGMVRYAALIEIDINENRANSLIQSLNAVMLILIRLKQHLSNLKIDKKSDAFSLWEVWPEAKKFQDTLDETVFNGLLATR